MWSTTANDDVIINLFAVGSIECEINKVWAEFPSGFRYLLCKCSNAKEAREVFEMLKKELMQAVPVRVCYHGTKDEIEKCIPEYISSYDWPKNLHKEAQHDD